MSKAADNDYCPNCGSLNCPASCYFGRQDEDVESTDKVAETKMTKKDYLIGALYFSAPLLFAAATIIFALSVVCFKEWLVNGDPFRWLLFKN